MTSTYAVEEKFRARSDLHVAYGNNARLLFALQLKFDIEDIHAVARDALVDGTGDKKSDLVYLDRLGRRLVVAQGYEAQDAGKGQVAPTSKAADLNIAATWLFCGDLSEMNLLLQVAAREVRTAIHAGEIDTVEFWYVHNRPCAAAVEAELRSVEHTVRNALRNSTVFPDQESVPTEVVAVEVGLDRQEEWYRSLCTHILVAEEVTFEVTGFFEVAGEGWRSVVTTVRARDLRALYERHKSELFSANYRDFLGTARSRRTQDINTQMQRTAADEPGKFWVYNNGVSAIVHEVKAEAAAGGSRVTVTGISIVNGAQTTGSLGTLATPPADNTLVPIRFVRCDDDDTVGNIIRYNNSQNPLMPADYRSNDEVQQRLRREFAGIPGARYNGGRRGVPSDRVAPPGELMPADTVAQALAAFHQEPRTAYHKKATIWTDEETYRRLFSEQTTASHVVFVYGLLKAVEEHKKELRKDDEEGKLTTDGVERLKLLRIRGAPVLLTSAVARCVETLVGRATPNPWRVSFGPRVGASQAIEFWMPVVRSLGAFHAQLGPAASNGLGDERQTETSLQQFAAAVLAMRSMLDQSPDIRDFAGRVVVE